MTSSLRNTHVNVAMMTSGGLAPCLSSSIGQLIQYWTEALDQGTIEGLTIRLYKQGYKGLLTGDSILLPQIEWKTAALTLNQMGGSPIGNSRVKVREHVCSVCLLCILYRHTTL